MTLLFPSYYSLFSMLNSGEVKYYSTVIQKDKRQLLLCYFPPTNWPLALHINQQQLRNPVRQEKPLLQGINIKLTTVFISPLNYSAYDIFGFWVLCAHLFFNSKMHLNNSLKA